MDNYINDEYMNFLYSISYIFFSTLNYPDEFEQ